MKVLSLFDGIACGRVALDRANITVDEYYAYEIEPNAIKIAKGNYPDIKELGNVLDADFTKYENNIDILIGGSPCVNFSSLGNGQGLYDLFSYDDYLKTKSEGNLRKYGDSCLFWEYIRALKEAKPAYFLLENVAMSNKWMTFVTDILGVEPIAINSSLVSAQNRPRVYWTNIPNVTVPNDKNIKFRDIVYGETFNLIEHPRTFAMKGINKLIGKIGYIPQYLVPYNAKEITDKGPCLTTSTGTTASSSILQYKDGKWSVANSLCWERMQTLPDGYTHNKGVSESKAKITLGNAWTVDVIAHIFKGLKEV